MARCSVKEHRVLLCLTNQHSLPLNVRGGGFLQSKKTVGFYFNLLNPSDKPAVYAVKVATQGVDGGVSKLNTIFSHNKRRWVVQPHRLYYFLFNFSLFCKSFADFVFQIADNIIFNHWNNRKQCKYAR